MKERIRQQALDLGFDDCRFTTADAPESVPQFTDWIARGWHGHMQYLERNADKRANPQLVLSGAKTLILLAASYASPEGRGPDEVSLQQSNGITPHGVVARYARHLDYHGVLAERLKALADFLAETTGPGCRSRWYTDTGPILERDLAARSGLGFVGKHTNLISKSLGNWVFLASILTTVELEPDKADKNRCGSCTRCLSACPTEAIRAPFQLDARRCISYLTIELKGSIPAELRPLIGERIFGCDDCLAACPWNRFSRQGRLMRDSVSPDLDRPNLLKLLELDDAEFKRCFAETPLIRSKRRGLLRNVCVALGNIGSRQALPALLKAADDAEPLISEHARWAIERIQKRASKC